MGLDGTVADMVHAVHAHPTLAEGMHEAFEGVFGSAIHI
jgi:pyruvate/2-oxoglutarate dehydrogenase complex dihydrolipoamide dehydrogenase (E3) component